MKNNTIDPGQPGEKVANIITRKNVSRDKQGDPQCNITLTPTMKDAAEWRLAARMCGQSLEEWIVETIDQAAFNIVNKERIEAILDVKAYTKAKSGVPISWDEFERSQRYELIQTEPTEKTCTN